MKIKRKIHTNKGLKGGLVGGKSHAENGTKAVIIDDSNKPIELEAGEAVVKKSALKDKTVKTLTGTNAEILNMINTRAGGNPIYAPSEVKMKNGGSVGDSEVSNEDILRKAEKEYFDLNDFRVDEDYDEDAAERNQRLVAIPKYRVSWESDYNSQEIGFYDTLDEAIEEAKTNVDYQERDLESSNRVSLYFDVAWIGMDNYIEEEVETKVSLYDLKYYEKYNLPNEIEYLDEELYIHYLSGSEDNSKELLSKVEDNLGDDISDEIEVDGYELKVQGRSGKKYSVIDIIYNKDDEDFIIGSIKLRIADHAYNPRNNQIDTDFISVEIVNENLTAGRFGGIKSLEYDGDSDYDDIVNDVKERVLEIVERWDVEERVNENTFEKGGNITPSAISKMTKAEQKAFYKTKEGKALDKETYSKWKSLVNMSKGELESFYNSKEGKEAGLSAKEAKAEGIDSGRESARWIMKMKDIPYTEWTSNMWIWAKKQISFISRMKGMRGDLYDDKGNKTRKHLALLIWGHNPKKMAEGGSVGSAMLAPNGKPSNLTPEQYKLVRTDAFKEWFGDWENSPETASKVVDENGEPLVVYHGTNTEFYEFDLKYFGKTDKGWYGKGFYFTPNKEFSFARDVVEQYGGKEIILKVFLCIKNPFYGQAFAEQQSNLVGHAKDRAQDGVIIRYDYGHENEGEIPEIIVWNPSQIKLADGTNTTFDSDSNDIRYKEGGSVGSDILSPYIENLKLNGIVLSDKDLVVLMYNEGKHKRSKGLYSPTILRKHLSGISEELANQLTIDLAMEWYDLFDEKDISEYLKKKRIIIVNNTKVVFDNQKKMAEGGNVGDTYSKAISASSRFKPRETIVFDKPIVGKNGNKYQWAYEWTMLPNREGELKDKRISNWEEAEISAETGRDIVHKFTVEKKDGDVVTVSSETIPSLLGYVDAKEMRNLPSLVSSVKTLAKQKMQLAILKAQEEEYNNIKKQVEEMPFPKIERKQYLSGVSKSLVTKWVAVGLDDAYQLDYENKSDISERDKESLISTWKQEMIKKMGGKQPRGIYDLEKRIKRQEKKVQDATSVDKMAEGGNVDDKIDWAWVYNLSDDDSTPTKEQREIENEKVVQEVINTLNKKIESINLEIEDWGSRKYKSNKGVVYAGGDDIHGAAYTIGSINENRRRKRLESLHYLKLTTEKAIDIAKNYDVSRYGSFKDNIIEDFKNLRYTDKRGNKLHWREQNALDNAYDILINNTKKMADGGNVDDNFEENEYMMNEEIIFEEGGNIPSETKTPEQMAKEFLNSLPQDAIEELKSKLREALSELVVREKNALDVINAEIADLEAKKEALREDRSGDALRKRSDYYNEIRQRQKGLIHQTNRYYAVKNGGSLSTFTDKKGVEHESIPDFTAIGSENISFDEENILTQQAPEYIPIINEDEFRIRGYMFDAIRYSSDVYILAVNGYRETISKGMNWGDTGEHPSDSEQGYVLVTLDQLVLINDYYYTKAKATERKKAEETNKRTEESYDRIPRERRESHYAQKYFYESMPVSVKKKVTKDAWEALTLEGKEAIYKPIKMVQGKRLVSQLEDDKMWASFHNMYERFLNPEAKVKIDGRNKWGHPEVFEYWYYFRDMMKWKLKDIKFQRQFLSDIRKTALETSFGMSNTNESLYDKFGILVKRQNGSNIKPLEIEQIKGSWINVNKIYGGLVSLAKEEAMKISHTGTTLVFASKAAGVYIPNMKTIAVSAKYGDEMFENILAHEVAHWIDNKIGEQKRLRWATDNYEDTAGIIASTFRKKMNQPSDSDYINATKECFARALEQHFAISVFGEAASVFPDPLKPDLSTSYFESPNYVNKTVYENTMKPLITKFFEENKDFFKYGIEASDLVGENDKKAEPVITPNEVKTDVVVETEEDRIRKEFEDLAKADTMTAEQKANIERMADGLADSLKRKKKDALSEVENIGSEEKTHTVSKENLLLSLEGARVAVEFLEGQKKQDMIDYIGGLEVLIEKI